MRRSSTDRARARAIAKEIAAISDVLPGTLSERYLTCRSEGCHCHDDPPELHGPYWYWTRKVDQKTVSKLLSAEQVPDYAEWFANRHRLRDLLHELEELGIATLEADPRTPRRAKKKTTP
jgi:hypothetical protein